MRPRRTCVGCRRTTEVDELVRIYRSAGGDLALGAGPGRGAWMCGPPAASGCLDRALDRRALERALRAPVRRDDVRRVRATLENMSG